MFVYFCLIDMQIGGLGRISADRLQLWPDETFQQHYTSAFCIPNKNGHKENLAETSLISIDGGLDTRTGLRPGRM